MKLLSTSFTVSLAALCLGVAAQSVQPILDQAKANLIQGRSYLVGFPKTATREMLREGYLGIDTQGNVVAGQAKLPILDSAIAGAVAARANTNASPSQFDEGRLIAWESLETLLNGQIVAGNASLLDGLRVAFPTGSGGTDFPVGNSDIPIDTPVDSTGSLYTGADVKALVYARHYFQDGIAEALDFMSNDPEGTIRFYEALNQPFPQYTTFNTPELMDPNFTGVQNIENAGYLLGNALDGFGKAVIGVGDRLWRGAYFDRNRAPGGSKATERQEMLDKAVATLQQGIHAQYMAVLPLAATMDEAELGYQVCRIDQARVSASTAAAFIDRIRAGEPPKLDTLALNASTDDIKQEISFVNQLKASAASKYSLAQTAIWRVKDAENALIDQAAQLRLNYNDQLQSSAGLNPGAPTQPPYFGLSTAQGRSVYKSDLAARIQQMLSAGADSPLLTDGTDLGQSVLTMLRAFNEVSSAQNKVSSIPQQIAIEDARDAAVNQLILSNQDKVGALNVALGILNSVSVSVTAGVSYTPPAQVTFSAGVNVTINPNAVPSALLQNEIARDNAIEQANVNNVNSAATIKNLLLQESQAAIDLKTAAIQAKSAVAGVNAVISKIDRLVENQIYYQQASASKWYSDPAIIFQQEQEEIDYQNALTQYQQELYVLSQKLALRWSEGYENPYLKSDGTAETLGSADYDGFTQPESIFAVAQASQADSFLDAMRAWDLKLRAQRTGGQADIQSLVSLRQDIFGFSDIIYDPVLQRFTTNPDPAARELNKQRFRALLLRNQEPTNSPYLLRLEFPITYGQLSRATPGALVSQPALILVSRSDWNVRMTDLSAVITGQNVAQSAFNSLRLDLVQYGKLEIPAYFPRETSVYPNFLTFNLPLYYPDPEEESINSFTFALNAGINGQPGQSNAFIPTIEPTPFCDRYVLLIEKQANPPINLQNIEDIQLTIKSRSSIPPQFFQ